MRIRLLPLLLLPLFITAAGCRIAAPHAATMPRDAVTQVATIDALLAGVYDGEVTLAELRRYGDTGIGTVNGLDGELLLLDGNFYQIRADGRVYRPDPNEKTPFAAVTFFQPQQHYPARPWTEKQLCAQIDRWAPDRNLLLAIRITGYFTRMRTRSVPAQRPPYRPLTAITEKQPEFELEKVSGTIVGFRLPSYVKGINVPGYHWHFITADHRHGGHILNFQIISGRIELQTLARFYLLLPRHSAGFAAIDLGQDRTEELRRAEQ
ncbi:MAG: acetolactate decarboxylase [Victivallales bacterium]|nr:acetolactate decarboxylase [Victivallales bacterium]